MIKQYAIIYCQHESANLSVSFAFVGPVSNVRYNGAFLKELDWEVIKNFNICNLWNLLVNFEPGEMGILGSDNLQVFVYLKLFNNEK